MNFQITSVGLIAIITLFGTLAKANSQFLSCSEHAKARPVIPNQVKGLWYEIARLPSSEVPACLKVIVPESESNGNYTLKLDYVNNINKGWQPTEQTLVFPWAEAQKGNFNLKFYEGLLKITIKFKYLGSLKGYSVVCGYSDFVPSISVIRILSRNNLVNRTIKAEIDSLANRFNISLSQLTWVQQDGRCNGTDSLSNFGIGVLLFLFLLAKIFRNVFSA